MFGLMLLMVHGCEGTQAYTKATTTREGEETFAGVYCRMATKYRFSFAHGFVTEYHLVVKQQEAHATGTAYCRVSEGNRTYIAPVVVNDN